MASCRNLVLHDKKLDVLRFAHLSVRGFLERQSNFKLSENELVVAERCLDRVSATYSGVHVKGQCLQQNIDLPNQTILKNLRQFAEQPGTPLFSACIFRLPRVLCEVRERNQTDLSRMLKSGLSIVELAADYG